VLFEPTTMSWRSSARTALSMNVRSTARSMSIDTSRSWLAVRAMCRNARPTPGTGRCRKRTSGISAARAVPISTVRSVDPLLASTISKRSNRARRYAARRRVFDSRISSSL